MKNKIGYVILITFVIYVLANQVIETKTDANKIFYGAINSIVEIKAESDEQKSYGTAVFIKEKFLVTNAHVVIHKNHGEVIPYETFYMRFADENEYRMVKLIKYDELIDIAVLKLEDEDINIDAISIGNSESIDFGDRIYAIGNSMNSGLSITEGIIGIPDIVIEYEGISREMIQADITITSGNSGGALLNNRGELIGITTCRIKDVNGDVVYGIAYSIPINKVIDYLETFELL